MEILIEYHQVSNESVKALHEFPVGHSFLLQGRVCSAIEPSESHSLPPFCGAGLLQVRVRVLIPLPHDTEQVPHFPHRDHLPSTNIRVTFKVP